MSECLKNIVYNKYTLIESKVEMYKFSLHEKRDDL